MTEYKSWFRDTPHRWASESLPLAYATACVEVVSQMSEKAGMIYQQMIEAWGKPGVKGTCDKIIPDISEADKERIKQALMHPETGFLPDPNKPFKDINEIFNDEIMSDTISLGDSKEGQEFRSLHDLLIEFVTIVFNRESDIAKGRLRVTPNGDNHWLLLAVALRTFFEHQNITLEKLRKMYKLRRYKGKIINFHRELTEKPTSRWHRRMVASSKAVNMKLKNDRVIMETARLWYKCRVVYPSINKFLDSEEGTRHIELDLKNIQKQIRPCDDAVGYKRRLPRYADS